MNRATIAQLTALLEKLEAPELTEAAEVRLGASVTGTCEGK